MTTEQMGSELKAVEAVLATLEPAVQPSAKERTKALALLESCHLAQNELPILSREQLIETIVKTGEPEITFSLREYVKSVKTGATLQGLLFGVILGVLIGGIGTLVLVHLLRSEPPQTPVQNHYYRIPDDLIKMTP